VAEDAESECHGEFAGTVVSVEASVVMVGPGTIKGIIGDSDIRKLNSIPLERIMQAIGEGNGARVVSSVKLSMRNGSDAEVETEDSEEISNRKDEKKAEQISNEAQVSFQAMSHIIDVEKIEVCFDFKHIFWENNSGSTDRIEEQIKTVRKFEMSSEVVLRPGQPRIIGATKKNEAMFLIMSADI
jgi:hypothetical protein